MDRDALVGTRLGTPVPTPRQPAHAATTPAPAAALHAEPTPGLQIHQYELIREIGRGGMGMVFAARDVKLGRRVAIKFLRDASREVAERFLIEARATAQCNHDNIVIIHEVDEYEGMPYMVLEFLEGQTLRDAMGPLDESDRWPASRVVEVGVHIARALARAHERGIVHRDLKPENVFLTSSGQVKVLDFGIAKALGGPDAASVVDLAERGVDLALTRDGTFVGTLPYMSPEQMGAGDVVDHRSDLWAFGIILYELLSGHHPVQPLEAQELVTRTVIDDPLPSIGAVVPGLPDALVRLVELCLRKPKHDRIASAAELVRRLEGLVPGRHTQRLDAGASPFVGLTAFQEADADRFFGRDRDVAKMVARVRELPLTAVVGPSGVGKSSFVRAGLGPALKASGETWEVLTLRPGRHPIAALASIVQRAHASGIHDAGELAGHRSLVERLRVEPGHLGALLRERAHQIAGQILLFVDQFEELYTLVADPVERLAFTAALAGVADDSAAPLRVVVSMRSDFLDRVAEDPRFTEELSRGIVFLAPPDRACLREALVQPLAQVDHRFESDAMVDEMLDALGTTPGALPLLQFAAAKLWDGRDRARQLLTVASYRTVGGISGALAAHADDVVEHLDARGRQLAQRVLRRLVTPDRTRAIVELADLQALASTRGEVDRVLDQLVAARLLISSSGSVELVHESLIDRWPTLRRWLDEDHEDAVFVAQLAAAAKQWDAKGRSGGTLWRGDALDEARRWDALRPRELAERERAFLDAAFASARRGRLARRAATIAAFVVLVTVAAGATVAYVQIRRAEQAASDNAARAQREAARATDALAQMQRKEAERQAAEQRRAAAEQQRVTAETGKAKVEAELHLQSAQVAKSREELEAANKELETTLAEARAARVHAEEASRAAVKSAADAEKARAELAVKLERERAHVKELEDAKKKLSTQLKE